MAVSLTSSQLRGRPDLRVGGGYSMYGNTWTGSPRRSSPRRSAGAPKEAETRRVREFPARGVVALQVLQGGATLWTAEADGSICVRNGFSGDVTSAAEPGDGEPCVTIKPQDNAQVVRLFATDTHMWVGQADGGLRVYDHLVVVQVFPEGDPPYSKPHRNQVQYFCTVPDGCVISGDIDGNLLKWSGEETVAEGLEGRPFEVMASGTADGRPGPGQMALSALDTSGKYVYAGDTTGTVHVLQVMAAADGPYPEVFEHLFSWDTGHASVTAIKYMDGLLFTGGTDKSVKVWEVHGRVPVEAQRTVPLDASAKRLIGDPRAHQIWAVDGGGAVTKLESTAPFMKREEQQLQLGPFADITTFTTWDAVRVWSTGSNGANFSWFAQWSRAEEQMAEAAEGMRHIVEQDQKELERWQRLINELERIDRDRKDKIARALSATTSHGLSSIYFRQWQLWLQKRYEVERRAKVSELMFRNTTNGLLHIYWVKLLNHWQGKKLLRQKRALCENIMATTEKGLRRIYWRKIDEYRHRKKQEAQKTMLGEALLANTETGMCRKYFRKAMRYLDRMRIQGKRSSYATVLMRSCDNGLRRIYYRRLERVRVVTGRRRRRDAIGRALASNTKRGLQTMYYRKFCTWGEALKQHRQKRELADALRRTTQRGLLASYQQKCDAWLEEQRKKRLEQELRDKKARLADLQRQEREQQERMERFKALDELQDHVDKLNQNKKVLSDELAKLRKEHADLLEAKRRKEAHEEDMKHKAMTLDDAMAKLKEMALNFDADFDAIQKNTDRCASSALALKGSDKDAGAGKPVIAQFLQAHMNVKAQLMQLPGAKHIISDDPWWPVKGEGFIDECYRKHQAGDEQWKEELRAELEAGEVMPPPWDLDGRFAKIQKFQYNVIGPAIKTMVILFDMMSKADKDLIKTDGEIIINAKNMMHLCENAARVKEKRVPKEFNDSTWKSKVDAWRPLWEEFQGWLQAHPPSPKI
eukprot:TRINITY_DN19441_c0_g1_i2.p1 TRINITY_DN19441_c0_g1~~TRINITY_DN19441_c0_g1_i2.p1  ORF type:complete len:1018 (+),score=410.37 TRINITY_DN19441_c0_g1_i2:111-3056(+)